MHRWCVNAERGLKRAAEAAGKEAVTSLSDLKKNRPARYREMVLTLVVQGARTADDTAKAKALVEMLVACTECQRNSTVLMLPGIPFKAYHKFWWNWDQDKCDEEWLVASGNLDLYDLKPDGTKVVAVQDFTRIVGAEGGEAFTRRGRPSVGRGERRAGLP